MSSIYFAQNKLAEAEQSYKRALEINEKTIGIAHPELLAPLKEYAFLLRKMQKVKEAAALETRFKAISGAKTAASEKK